MKFAFIGYDYTLDIAQTLMADGHELIELFTFPCDNVFSFNAQISNFADQLNIPITIEKITEDDIERCITRGCTLFICAGYIHKIPPIDETKAYGLNIHPAILPQARGIMPLPYVILEDNNSAGFTVHKLDKNFDTGDIVYIENIESNDQTDVETLSAQIALKSRNAITDIVNNLTQKWTDAKPQDETLAKTYPNPSEKMRTLNWDKSIEELLKIGHAFGRYGVFAIIENDNGQKQKLAVFQFSGWVESHNCTAGTLMRSSPREIIIAVTDGFICLKDFHALDNPE